MRESLSGKAAEPPNSVDAGSIPASLTRAKSLLSCPAVKCSSIFGGSNSGCKREVAVENLGWKL